ncbi:MAG: hypothetical protein IJW80_07280, partial [Alistipes sp.]|nr:hypothetical protein [Alistipes sp.]
IGVLAPEGPYAVGDHVKNFHSYTDICPYGSAWSGIFAGIVQTTDVEGILQLDCNATDYFGDRTLPHYLLFNPHATEKRVTVKLPDTSSDIYDLVSGQYIARQVSGETQIDLGAKQTLNLVCIPAGTKLRTSKGRVMADKHVVSYRKN